MSPCTQRAVLASSLPLGFLLFVTLVAGSNVEGATRRDSVDYKAPQAVADQIDRMIDAELERSGSPAAAMTSDEDFLRRVTFDLAGTTPSPRDVTMFGLDADAQKRSQLIERLLGSEEFSRNWARYWRDVIFSNATEMRALRVQGPFEDWMTEQLQQNKPWDEIVTSLITATGNVREAGETGLIFAHGGRSEDIAAESSRIFLGIQIQCANCHDHPSDRWKRRDFHELAAYFPRLVVRPVRDSKPRTFEVISRDPADGRGRLPSLQNPDQVMKILDRDGDGRLTRNEVKGNLATRLLNRLIERGDLDKDNALTLIELKKLRPGKNRRRGNAEHYMPDLDDPSSLGTQVDPKLFTNALFSSELRTKPGLDDLDRRQSLARHLTDPRNRWFAKAIVNRIWAELLGEGFYMPVDDMGPQRTASYPEVLELLATGLIANDYDVRWLFRVIANTEAYQRRIRSENPQDASPPFASASPMRLRADQLYNAIIKVLDIEGVEREVFAQGRGMMRRQRGGTPRQQFGQLFGFDPSTPPDDLVGTIPQALFMMNSPAVNNLISSEQDTRLARLLKDHERNEDAVSELYVLTLAREPSKDERQICLEYIAQVGDRNEAFEDIMWSLLNSSEFMSKR